jgi:two-component system nitrate/nitrite response regulator NarL
MLAPSSDRLEQIDLSDESLLRPPEPFPAPPDPASTGFSVIGIHVLVISGVCLYRDGLAALLARQRRVESVATAADVAEGVETARAGATRPDVVLLDSAGIDIGAAICSLREQVPEVQVVALTVQNREQELLAAAEAGAVGFVTVEASIKELVATIESAHRGEALCSPSLAAALMRRLAARASQHEGPAPMPALTSREREIVELIDEGLSNKQIALQLRIELATVKNHVHNILGKLGVRRRGEAAALLRAGRA